jgi:hypothetical protein
LVEGKVALRFQGLDRQEIAQLTDCAKEFASNATRSRRLLGVYVSLFVMADELKRIDIKLPGPFFITLPLELLITLLLVIVSKSICRILKSKIDNARPRALAVWLRRFHQFGADRFPIHELFEELSAWGVLACTLSDDVVYKSTLAERSIRRWANQRVMQLPQFAGLIGASQEIVFILGLISLFGIAFVLIATRQFTGAIQFLFVLAYLALIVISAVIAWRGVMRLFYRTEKFQKIYKPIFAAAMADSFSLGAVKAPDYFAKVSSDLRQQHLAMQQGFLAFVVADDDWQAVVGAAIARASIVLVDVTELSKNLQWELQQIAKTIRLERVVLAFGFSENGPALDEDWERHPSCSLLDEYLGLDWRSNCQKFSYPQHLDTDQKRGMLNEYMHRLVMKVYEAAALSGQHSDQAS